MKIIVPLAGPDFVASGSTKAQFMYKGQPLLRYALESRPWWVAGLASDKDLIFVLNDNSISRKFSNTALKQWYPACRVVFLEDYTRGAGLTVLAGISLIDDVVDEPLCLDLADIYFEMTSNPLVIMHAKNLDALALTFNSDKAEYSYIKLNSQGHFDEAVEKKVISDLASAGVYFYRNSATYLKALGNIIAGEKDYTHNRLYYVCPVFNGVHERGTRVGTLPVSDVDDVKFIGEVK